MEGDDLYRAPKAALRSANASKPGLMEKLLRYVLLVVYGFFAAILVLAVPLALAHGLTAQSVAGLANGILLAFFAVMTLLCTWRRQPRLFLHSLLLFVTGAGLTAVYRLAFVVDELDAVDFNNAMLFGVPAVLALVYSRLLAGREGLHAPG